MSIKGMCRRRGAGRKNRGRPSCGPRPRRCTPAMDGCASAQEIVGGPGRERVGGQRQVERRAACVRSRAAVARQHRVDRDVPPTGLEKSVADARHRAGRDILALTLAEPECLADGVGEFRSIAVKGRVFRFFTPRPLNRAHLVSRRLQPRLPGRRHAIKSLIHINLHFGTRCAQLLVKGDVHTGTARAAKRLQRRQAQHRGDGSVSCGSTR